MLDAVELFGAEAAPLPRAWVLPELALPPPVVRAPVVVFCACSRNEGRKSSGSSSAQAAEAERRRGVMKCRVVRDGRGGNVDQEEAYRPEGRVPPLLEVVPPSVLCTSLVRPLSERFWSRASLGCWKVLAVPVVLNMPLRM